MDVVMAGHNFETCLVHLEHIIIFSHRSKEHLLRLERLFQRLRQANLKLKPSKRQLFQRRVAFLEFVVSEEGVETEPEKINAVVNWPIPNTLRKCRGFVSLCQYSRRFVPSYSDIAAPLHILTQKGAQFV